MVLPGTEIHIVVFVILLFEIALFFFQIFYFLSRPSDQNRLWYLLLLTMIIYYNIVSGFLPDVNIPLAIPIQNCIAYSGGLLMSMYFPVYFYKTFNLNKLKFYSYGGSILFLLVPFILFFLVPYYFTGNLSLSRQLVVVVPFFYSFSFIVSLTRAIIDKGWYTYNKEVIAGVYLGLIFWSSLPIIVFFDGSQLLENSFANAGLLVMTILYLRKAIKDARREYENLLISEKNLKEMNKDLLIKVKERTIELEKANEQQTNTFINLAHEMKTPLMLLSNYLDDYMISNQETEELRLIKASTTKLSRDIVNLFDLGKIEKGIDIYNHDQVSDFSVILSDILKMFKPYAAKKHVNISAVVKDAVFIKADPDSLHRLVYNLVENAIKYSKESGNVHILLEMLPENKVCFSVNDNGIGISTSFHKHLFDPYFQIRSEKNNNQGIGIGLTIVKRIIDSLHGEIKIKSSDLDGSGTSIRVCLPCVMHQTATYKNNIEYEYINIDVEKLSVNDSFFSQERPYVLIVEDNIALINYIGSKLKERYNIFVALNKTDAVEKLDKIDQLDIIISDLMMDNGNGFDLYNAVLENKKFDHIPFIFITASISQNDKIKALKMGAIDFIQKPFQINELTSKIDSILQTIEKQKFALIDSAYKTLRKGNMRVSGSVENRFESSCIKFSLTSREIEIVKEIAKGKTYKNISEMLNISDKTVAKHIQNIFEKVSVTRQAELLNKLGFGQSE